MTKTIKLSALLSTGKLWEKGEHSRTYLNAEDVATELGFTWARYKTGNIKRAAYDGEEIYNAEMRRVFGALEGVYFDNHAKKLGAARFFYEMLKSYDIELVDDVNADPEPEAPAEAEAPAKAEEAAPRTHGGRREGAGRKPAGHVPSTIRLSPEQTELLRSLGGSAFLRMALDGIKAGKLPIIVETTKLTDEQKDRFVEGWTNAGGECEDFESPDPWFAPWHWAPEIVVHGVTPEEWGSDWFRQCKPEIDATLTEDEE